MTETSRRPAPQSCLCGRRALQIGLALGLLGLLTALWVRGDGSAGRRTSAGPTDASGSQPADRPQHSASATASAGVRSVPPTADGPQSDHPGPADRAAGPRSGNETPDASHEIDAVPDDERLRQMVLGTWEQFYYGRRVLTIREDGTATMDVRPDGIGAFIVGSHLVIDVEWQIEDGRAIFLATGGRPESSYKIATSTWGTSFNRPIVEITDEKFVLLKEEDGSKGEWKRIAERE